MELDVFEQKQRKKSTTKMVLTKEVIERMDPEAEFESDVKTLDVGVKEINVTICFNQSKAKKAHQLTKSISDAKPIDIQISKNSDRML